MEAARWLVAFVAVVTAVGGLLADYFIPGPNDNTLKTPPGHFMRSGNRAGRAETSLHRR